MTHDRMETITDRALIRDSDEPDPFRRNPVAQTGPDDPWRFTRFVADDHECVIVRDEYDEPAPFGSCSTHRRALSSPVALGCATPAPVGAAVALDLDAVEAEFLRQCGGCDAGLMVGCTCSQRDFRPTMLALVAEVRRLTRLGQCDLDLLMRAEAAEAEVVTLRAQVKGLHEELLRGDPDVVTLRARLAEAEALHWKVGGACSHCSQRSDYAVAWPCETAVALAVTTGEGK